ncbi:Integrase [Theobroma cacao]|nr:Integrase [Theobroma cacao]
MPDLDNLREKILKEAHVIAYTVHPRATKMYHDLKIVYWWQGLKKDVAKYVARCLTCLQVKAEHGKSSGLLQPLPILEWKWEHVTMDFVTRLPRVKGRYDSIWIVRLHGVPVTIVSNRGPQFTNKFWRSLYEELGTHLEFTTTYRPQTNGQSEHKIQMLEDMLRSIMLDFGITWDNKSSLVEFAYNNSYQASIGMAPFEALYEKKCRSPVEWFEVGENRLLGPEMVQQAIDVVSLIQERLKSA